MRITYKPGAGEPAWETLRCMLYLANYNGQPIRATFNGAPIVVLPGESEFEAASRFRAALRGSKSRDRTLVEENT